MAKKKLVVLSGAGVSAESGIATFRDANGLWEGHDVMEVASPQGFRKNPELVLEFYNQRRRQAASVKPNDGHLKITELEKYYDVTVITQNVDNLHEKAGSSNVIHLHGELFKCRSCGDEKLVYDMEAQNRLEINLGDLCDKGHQLRPHIVWFGEMVPMMDIAMEITRQADVFIVIGTSLQVYPAAGLVDFVKPDAPIYVIDPNLPRFAHRENLYLIPEKGTEGMRKVFNELTSR
jgi:NAD-dependent deacetylase